ncbi:MAG: GerMN domain-containing protein [Deltaproteobacteria bacterium]|jgi:spore germination protein GerM|nr:GerMN domain-containing protein [Deltaproteobacteria bacterium]
MKKRSIGFLALASIAGVVLLLVLVMGRQNTRHRNQIQKTMRSASMTPAQTKPVHLYFSDKDSQFLMAENRVLKSPQDPEFFARSIIEALIKGPQQGLTRTLPAATVIRAIFVTQEGTCFVDLTSAVTENHPGGIQSELLTIYSIVNSLVLNVPQIKAVKILINGTEAMTLAGHIDLEIPIKANMLLIR